MINKHLYGIPSFVPLVASPVLSQTHVAPNGRPRTPSRSLPNRRTVLSMAVLTIRGRERVVRGRPIEAVAGWVNSSTESPRDEGGIAANCPSDALMGSAMSDSRVDAFVPRRRRC